MKILVDWQKCTGIGICEALSPDTFEVGDDGKLQLINGEVIPEGLEARSTPPSRVVRRRH